MSRRSPFVVAFSLVVTSLVLWSSHARPVVRAQGAPPVPITGGAVAFAETAPLRDIASAAPAPTPPQAGEPTTDVEIPLRTLPRSLNERFDLPAVEDPGPRAALAATNAPAPSLSFEGISNADNAAVFGFRLSPPDTNGDVGPNHYVQTANLLVRVFNKAGVALTPAFKMSSLFAALGGPCATRDDGDPIVLYDPLADRWLLSQFCTVATPNTHQMIAISKTGDPTGAYFVYDFMMPNIKFNDYPKFGVWPDAYYMTDNQFNQAGTAFLGGGVFAFDRARLLAGDPAATFIYFDLFGLDANLGGMLPADLDGPNPPAPGTPNYFAYFTANEFGDPGDAVRIFNFHADFGNPAASTFTERAESPIAVAPFDPRSPAGRPDIEQPPPALATHNVDAIQDRLMHRLQYRNSVGYESLVMTHTVNTSGLVPTTPANHRAGIRYYELRRSVAGGSFGVQEQATFSPDADNRWMGSAAMDRSGDLAVGYSVSSLTTFPSIRYAGRLASDPPSGLFQSEATLVAGSGVQRSTLSRWGDYSGLTVDPTDDCTFWYTTEYYTAASQATSTVGWVTRIGRFAFPACVPQAPLGSVQGTVFSGATGLPMAGARVFVDGVLYAATGPAGTYSFPVAQGSHTVSATAPNFSTDTEAGVFVGAGPTSVRTLTISPVGTDVAIAKTGPGTAKTGDVLIYTITARNNGPLMATNVTVADPTPSGTVFLSVASSQGSCTAPASGAAGPVNCNLGTLTVGSTAALTFTVRIGASIGTITNTATISASQGDAIAGNNVATVTTSIECPGLIKDGPLGSGQGTHGTQAGRIVRNGVASSCGPPKAFPGINDPGVRTFDSFPITNTSLSPECVTVTLDAQACVGNSFLFPVAYLGSFDPANIATNYLADMGGSPNPAGQMSFTIPAGATVVLVVHNVTVGATCAQYKLSVTGLACAFADVAATKTAAPSLVLTGSNLSYTINATNNGPNDAIGAKVIDTIPANTTFVSMATTAGWSCTTPPVGAAGTIMCTKESMPPAAVATFSPIVKVNCSVSDQSIVANTATASSLTFDLSPGNNSASASATALNPAPVITGVSATPDVLFPPNHQMVPVTVAYGISDNCGVVTTTLSVTSSEPVSGLGDGDTAPDWEIVDDHQVRLRAERSGTGPGRVYTITITAVDSAGNTTTASVQVSVPHNK